MPSRTILDDSNDESEVCTCEAETECCIIMAQEVLTVLKVITQHYDIHMVLMGI